MTISLEDVAKGLDPNRKARILAEAEKLRAYALKNPPHPGAFVKAEIIEPAELSVTAAAEVLGITRQALSTFLNGQSDLSPEMAIRLDKAFGVSMETLMRMQCSYDIAKAHKRAGEFDVARFKPDDDAKEQPRLI